MVTTFNCDEPLAKEVEALQVFARANQRTFFEPVVSPLSVAEIANIQDISVRNTLLAWTLEMLDHWLVLLDDREHRHAYGGNVRHRFKLTADLQELEERLRAILDLRRDPFDRLLLLQYRMAACDVMLTTDERTIWRNREALRLMGIDVRKPSEFMAALGLALV